MKRVFTTGIMLAIILCLAVTASAGMKTYDCGTQALAYLLESRGDKEAAQMVLEKQPKEGLGHSVSDLLGFAEDRLDLSARYLLVNDLEEIPLPAIIYFEGKPTGHFSVLTKVDKGRYTILDPKTGTPVKLSPEDLFDNWGGIAMVSSFGRYPGIALSTTEQSIIYGGDNEAAPAVPPGDGGKGSPPECPSGNPACECKCPPCTGAPLWAVNPVNMNLYVVDTPLTYSPAIGPDVVIRIEYNTMSTATGDEIFGKKWTFKYNSYLAVAPDAKVTITMPDGKEKIYTPDGEGGYAAPYRTFDELVKVDDNHYELKFQSGLSYVYNSYFADQQKSYISEIKDSYHQVITIAYSDGRISTITDALGKVTSFIYNADNLVEQVDDPFGRSAHFSYNANRNLIRATDMAGYWTDLEYDGNDNLTVISNAGNRTEFYIEPSDNLGLALPYPPPGENMQAGSRITITHPNGGKEEFHYNGAGGYGWRVLPEDYVEYTSYHNNYSADVAKTIYYYADTAKGVREEISSINYPNGEAKFYYYDHNTGLKTATYDAEGNTTSYIYNDKGNVSSITTPRTMVTEYFYDDNDIDLVEIRNDLGSIFLGYDDHHNVVSFTGLDGRTTTIIYNNYGQMQTATGPDNIETTFVYRPDHTLEKVMRNGLVVSESSYDAIGRLASSKDATGLLLAYVLLSKIQSYFLPN